VSAEDRHKSLIVKALSIVPAVAIVAVVASSYISSAPEVIAARIYGGPPGPDHSLAWRVVVSLRDRGFFETVPNLPLSLHAGNAPPIEGRTDDEGAWEARIPLPNGSIEEIDIVVRRSDSDQVLLSYAVPVRSPAWQSMFRRAHPQLTGRRSGALEVDLFLLRSFVASSFPERALVRVSRDGLPVASAKLTVSGEGVSFDVDRDLHTDAEGRAWITLRPMFQAPTVEVEALDEVGDRGSFQCILPVRTGAMWIDPIEQMNGKISIVSPVGHRLAYLTFFNERARLMGTRVKLESDGEGGAKGSMALPSLPDEPAWVMVSPDPPGTGEERDLFGWPILRRGEPRPTEAAHASTIVLADGMPRAIAATKERKHAGRLRGMIILALAALIEASLLWSRARHAKLELERLLTSDADIDEAVSKALLGGSRFWLRMVIAVCLVAIGFGAMAFVTWIDGG
jgi:hypothetical protein